jgi:HEAT repeat protein
MRGISRILILAVAAAGLLAVGMEDRQRPPSQVFDRSNEPGDLIAKVDRTLADAPKSAAGSAFWVGYAIDRLMGEGSHIGSYRSGRGGRDLTIAEILAGKRVPEAPESAAGELRQAVESALAKTGRKGRAETKVVKELGIFLEYEPGRPPVLAGVRMSNLDLSLDFEGRPLFWLGHAPESQSLGLVEALYDSHRGLKAREGLVAAAGCHGTPRLVLPFLERVLNGDVPDELRKDAAFWMGQQNDVDGLRILAEVARTDRSGEVREGAVFGISQIELPAAVDELVSLARSADRRDVRKQAIFWLGQMASKKAGEVLEKIAVGDDALEIQEHAVFALSQLPGDEGLDALIRLARTHEDPRIRKKAVFWLGESDDPRALETIIAIIRDK